MIDAHARILAVTDLSPAGDVAIIEANRWAQQTAAALGVVHAIPTIDAIRPLFPQRLAEEAVLASQLPVQAEATLRHRLETLGVREGYELFVEQGTTADVTLGVVQRWQPTLLVVGSPADGAVGTAGLVRHATTAVLVARTSPTTKRVVIGTDFSDPSLPALRAAVDAAARMGGELVLVHAIEINPISIYGVMLPMFTSTSSDLHDVAEHRLGEVLEKLGVHATTQVYVGPPAPALIQAAKTYEAELLVVGTHGRTGLTRFLLGSVAEAVIQHAPCSVLVARLA
jgi:nucleotide-binding universal stress UspA family protein